MQNEVGTSQEDWHKSDTSGSVSVHPANENTDALAGATGAIRIEQAFKSEQYLKRAQAATVLTLAIAQCHPDDAAQIMDAALGDLAIGSPPPVFLSEMVDARWWAGNATTRELKAFALACFEAMHPKVRADFLGYVKRGIAA